MKIGKCDKVLRNLNQKDNHAVHINNFQETLNDGLKLKKVRKVINFNQK